MFSQNKDKRDLSYVEVQHWSGSWPLLGQEECLDAFDGAVLEQGVDHEGYEEEVGEGGREVDHLSAGLNAYTQVHTNALAWQVYRLAFD